MSAKLMSDKYTVHLCTGGLAHMLKMLGTSISYCEIVGRKMIPFSEINYAFQIPFYEIFSPNNMALVSEEEYDNIIEQYGKKTTREGPNSLSGLSLKFRGSKELGNRYVIYDGEIEFDYDLELDEEQSKCSNVFELTTGQRWTNPPRKGQRGKRSINISGGWPSSLRSIKINADIIKIAEERISRIGEEYIGVHYRNTDMRHDINQTFSSISEAIKKFEISNIFLATDDVNSIPLFAEKFPTMAIHHFSNIPNHKTLGQKSLHHMSEKALNISGLTKKKQIQDALCDIICLVKSKKFIPSENSAMSELVNYLSEDSEIYAKFVGPI